MVENWQGSNDEQSGSFGRTHYIRDSLVVQWDEDVLSKLARIDVGGGGGTLLIVCPQSKNSNKLHNIINTDGSIRLRWQYSTPKW